MIFLDSSFLIAYEVVTDKHHERALNIMKDIALKKYGMVFTSNFIFDETTTIVFARTKNLENAVGAGESILESFNLVEITSAVFKEAWDFFKNQTNTGLSFTDCSNVVVMQSNNIKQIATFDEDFKKIEGVRVVC